MDFVVLLELLPQLLLLLRQKEGMLNSEELKSREFYLLMQILSIFLGSLG